MGIEPTYLGWTWRAHFDDLLKQIESKQWLRVARKLAEMTEYAIERALGRPG